MSPRGSFPTDRLQGGRLLLVKVRDLPSVDALEEAGGVVISHGEDRELTSVEFLNAARRVLVQPNEMSVTLRGPRAA